jgi:hypothetical protein
MTSRGSAAAAARAASAATIVSGVSRATRAPQPRQWRLAARANRSFDRDRGRNAFDRVHLRLVHAVEELPRVGRERLDVAPLPLRVERVEHQRGLARARDAGHDDELGERQLEREVLEVVLARAADDDRAVGSCGHRDSAILTTDAGFAW